MTIATPCVGVCSLDPVTGYCRGCGRTIAEIAAWRGMTDAERRAVMATLAERRSASDINDAARDRREDC